MVAKAHVERVQPRRVPGEIRPQALEEWKDALADRKADLWALRQGQALLSEGAIHGGGNIAPGVGEGAVEIEGDKRSEISHPETPQPLRDASRDAVRENRGSSTGRC